ncbi:uncharacterized protein [Nicotiana sylvestris]|uniref:uncharacterized protein n=1 Tax=Nicotiana sylvestris TaxID=4096 RepID=UPI00388C68F6
MAQIIRLRAQVPNNPIKSIRLDNAAEFSSQAFNDYCLSIGIKVEHHVAHVHTQNGLAEFLIKRLQLIARPLLMKMRFSASVWGHAILHAAMLNVPIRIDVPIGQSSSVIANESKARLKCGRPLGSKDRNPRKRKTNDQNDTRKESHEEIHNLINSEIHEESTEPETQENKELSINPIDIEIKLNRVDIVVDYVFAYNVASSIMQESKDLEPQPVGECRQRLDWPKWQEAIQSKLNSLAKREVFGPVVQTPNGVKPVGYKCVFVCKRNE